MITLILHLKKLEKETTKPKVSRNKEKIKAKSQINKTDNRKTIK